MTGMSTMRRYATMWMVLWMVTWVGQASAADWTGFRGPGARGVSEETGLAVSWSETENLAWKAPLPGPGSSCPIVLGERVFVTCYSGYGLDPNRPGDLNNLKRHLLCVRTTDGEVLWDKAVPAALPEDSYRGMLREHGYASQTPVTDGQRVYVFFGKTGVLAFDLDGKQLWQRSVGTDSDQKRWGAAASLALYENLLFVNAWDESKTLYALDTQTGREVWKKDVSENRAVVLHARGDRPRRRRRGTGGGRSLPGLGAGPGNRPATLVRSYGHQRRHDPHPRDCRRYRVRPRRRPPTIRLSGRAHGRRRGCHRHAHSLVGKNVTSPPSPVLVDGLMYWADGYGRACCAAPKTGELHYSEKLPITQRFAIYGSVVAAEGRLYVVTRKDGTFVLAAKPQYQIVAHNQFASDDSDFNASPAVSNKCLFLRSNRFLYCVRPGALRNLKTSPSRSLPPFIATRSDPCAPRSRGGRPLATGSRSGRRCTGPLRLRGRGRPSTSGAVAERVAGPRRASAAQP